MSIIFADDDDFVRDVAESMLSCISDDVIIASDGAQALTKLQGNKSVKLVILDLNMPGMDGYTAVQKIRASGNNVTCVGFSAGTFGLTQTAMQTLEQNALKWASMDF